MKKKRKLLIILILLLLVIICAVIALWHRRTPKSGDEKPDIEIDSNADEWNGEQPLDQRKQDVKNIAIPGIQSLVFEVNMTKQKVNFYNPEENDCLMQFTLVVDDKELWQSGYCEPGKGYYNIELSEPIEAGTYQAHLHYGCYRQNGDALNSANMEFPLYVQ